MAHLSKTPSSLSRGKKLMVVEPSTLSSSTPLEVGHDQDRCQNQELVIAKIENKLLFLSWS